MKISLNWLNDFIDLKAFEPEAIGDMLTEIGLEVEGMETVESIKGGLKGLVIGEVVECQQHPNADRLSLTKVNIGGPEHLQIVCGAPNVAQGQKVVVATIGTTLYDAEDKPFVIKKGKMRGETSEGMICAEDEIGMGNDHSGIMVLDETATIGTPAADYFNVENDVVYEIGLTPNRSDATSHLGVAKDLAAYLTINHDFQGSVPLPDVGAFKVVDSSRTIPVEVQDLHACPRYVGVTLSGIMVTESPDWLKSRLNSVGVRPINSIVDVTNFILHELGQPLHAFDADQINGQKVIVKKLPEGTKFLSLDEQERSLHAEDLMICDGAEQGMCIAGVFGGIKSGVTETTKNIFLESAYFDPKTIRRTSMRHILRTDAATRFEKGTDPNIAKFALQRAIILMQELSGGTVTSEIVDVYPNPVERNTIEVSYAHVNRLIGVELDAEKVKQIVTALEMDIVAEQATGVTVAVPTNKHDVLREVDVIEEILRIYGFDKVPLPARLNSSIVIADKPDKAQIRNLISQYLIGNGFYEAMSLSLTNSDRAKSLFGLEDADLVFINNTSNVHLDVMRPNLLVSALENVLHNQNRKNADLRLFEIGKRYWKEGENLKEAFHLSLVLTGRRQAESWLNSGETQVSYSTIQAYVNNIIRRFGLNGFQQTVIQGEKPFSYAMRYHRGPQVLAEFGLVDPTMTQQMDIKQPVFYADLHWDNLLKSRKKHSIETQDLNRFPSVRRDLALVIDRSVKFQQIEQLARKTGKKLLKEINLFDVYENEEQLGADKRSYAVSFIFEDPAKTLKDKEIEKIMSKLIGQYEHQLGASIRR